MIFVVKRASTQYAEEAPCPSAYRGSVPCSAALLKVRTSHARFKDKRLSRGTEHTIDHDAQGVAIGIRRRIKDEEVWLVDIVDLIRFVDEHGRCIVYPVVDAHVPFHELLIYDDYIE